jgi:DNA-binding winged helix-turn-helix (wHTH) protein/tetratricopeptide (TPR) repeat protein
MPDHLLTRSESTTMTEENIEISERYEFANCVVDADKRELSVANEAVTMQPKAFELLLYLIRNRHRAVNKDELQDVLWPRSIVTETALTRCVMKARRAVGDDADKQAMIKTVHGHGYRFTAEVIAGEAQTTTTAEPLPSLSTAPRARAPAVRNLQPFKIISAAAGLFATIVFAWLFFSAPALSGPVRLAVLPIENATGDPEMDWVSTGLMALMSRMLQDGGIDTVSSREVSGLAGDAPLPELIATGSEFREKLMKTTAATHVIGAKLEDKNGLYRLTYTLAGADKRPTRRTMVGQEPTKLVKDVVSTVTALIVKNAPPLEGQSSVSNDEFVNEAYARAMALYHEGRYAEAKSLFDLIIEQEPHLFWPRYERALTIRNLRDFEGAERELIALRDEVAKPGMEREQAGIENALGVIYWSKRRHDEARVVLEKMVALSLQADDPMRAATGYQNLGLVEKNVSNVPGALAYMQKAEQVYSDMDIQMLPGSLLNNMSGVLIQMGHFEEAQSYSMRAIESFRLTGERRNEATAMSRLSDIYARQRFYDEATEAAESSLSVRRELDDQFGIGSSLIGIADISAQRGNYTRALQHALQAYDIGLDIDSPRITVPALIRIARAETRLGKPESAAARYAEVEAIAKVTDDPHNVFRARLGVADTKIELGLFDDALAIGTELLDEARDNDRQRDETAAMRIFSRVYSATGRHQEALGVLEEAFAIANELDDTVVMSSLHIRLAEEYLALNDSEAASPHIVKAASERPEDADSLKVQALFESMTGNADAAAKLMGIARTSAGEGWSEKDAAILAQYRAEAGTE